MCWKKWQVWNPLSKLRNKNLEYLSSPNDGRWCWVSHFGHSFSVQNSNPCLQWFKTHKPMLGSHVQFGKLE